MNKNISEATPPKIGKIFGKVHTVGDDIVVNMDGGAGGSWYTLPTPKLGIAYNGAYRQTTNSNGSLKRRITLYLGISCIQKNV